MVKAAMNAPHLHKGRTVIIGAGIVGLFIAHELASTLQTSNIEHEIVIVDLREAHCSLASGRCSGVLRVNMENADLQALGDVAQEAWIDIVTTRKNAKEAMDAIGYRERATFNVSRGDGKGRVLKPFWYTGHVMDSFAADKQVIGKVYVVLLMSITIRMLT